MNREHDIRRGSHRLGTLVAICAALFASVTGRAGEAPEAPTPEQVAGAVDKALDWLAENQITDGPHAGSWNAPSYRRAVAALAGLAFLAQGHTPGEGEYGAVLDRAMAYVKAGMDPNGYLGASHSSGMYVHAICTLYGLSYLGRSESPERELELAKWCRRSVALIVKAQSVRKGPSARGGWRYTPYTTESDLSVTSWQLLVLHAARQCGFEIDDAVFSRALKYLNNAFLTGDEGAGFLYRRGVSKTPERAVTGAALFIKQLLEQEPDRRTRQALAYLREVSPSWGGEQYNGYFFFGAFYMAQGMFQIGGGVWDDYEARIARILVDRQREDGRWDLPPDNAPQSRAAGPAYPTALGVLILSLEKQYLPMYQRQRRLY